MTTIQKLLMMACGCLFAMTVQGQNLPRRTAVADRPERMPGLKDWFLSTGNWQNDPQLYVLEAGTGADTVVMLHGGWGGDHSGLLEAVKGLENQYHFVFYDQRGSLRSPFPDSLITFNNHIEDLELLRKALGLDKMTLVGHSMGAVLAGAYAAKYPGRIRQLILAAPAPLKNPVPEADQALQNQGQQAAQAFLNRPAVTQELNKYGLNRKTPALSPQEETGRFRIEFAKRMLYDVGKWPRLTGGRALYKGNVFELTAKTYPPSGWNYVQAFANQSYPVSIIAADHDFLDFNNLLVRKWAGEVPRLKLSVVENAGHLLWVDQPEMFAKVLVQHLERKKH
jgi:proline-specific peptidase